MKKAASSKRFAYYCALCWQEFDQPSQHNAGSYYDGERLNGTCPGDIRQQVIPEPQKRLKRERGTPLEFSDQPAEVGSNPAATIDQASIPHLEMNMEQKKPVPTVTVENMKLVGKGSLRAFFSATIGGLTIHSCRVIQQEGQSCWVSLPQEEWTDRQGKKKYSPVVEVPDRIKDAIQAAALQEFDKVQSQQQPKQAAGW